MRPTPRSPTPTQWQQSLYAEPWNPRMYVEVDVPTEEQPEPESVPEPEPDPSPVGP